MAWHLFFLLTYSFRNQSQVLVTSFPLSLATVSHRSLASALTHADLMDAVLHIPSAVTTQVRRLMNSFLSNAAQYAMTISASAQVRQEPISFLCLSLARLRIHQAMSFAAALKQRRYRYC